MAIPAQTLSGQTTLSGCARAASAAELRYRIQRPIRPARAARIIALDDAAASVLSRIADGPWAHARFYLCEPAEDPAVLRTARGTDADLGNLGDLGDLPASVEQIALREIGGPSFAIAGELSASDVVVVVATGSTGRDYAAAIGQVCAARAIMTAGVVLAKTPNPATSERTSPGTSDDGSDGTAGSAAGNAADNAADNAAGSATDPVAALRPYARVLLPTADEADLVELLTALRV